MNTTGNKYGGRTKGTPNKLTSKINKNNLNRPPIIKSNKHNKPLT
jgi:hypothetical protein